MGASRYLSSPSGSVIKIGRIKPASFPSFFDVETDGIGKIWVSARTVSGWTDPCQTNIHTRNATKPQTAVIRPLPGRLLKTATFVLTSPGGFVHDLPHASPLRLLRPCWTASFSILWTVRPAARHARED